MHALIDADILAYEFGNCKSFDGRPLSWPLVQARVDGRIQRILQATGATSHQLYLTANDKSNFRIDIASIRPYKGNRTTEKPFWYSAIREFLIAHRDAEEVSGYEADDKLSIEQCNADSSLPFNLKETVICSRDKDLHMVPGWHYSWGAGKQKEQPLWWQDETEALRCFYRQLLTGDAVDNIPGLYRVGKSSSAVKQIGLLDREIDMYYLVQSNYEKYFGSYWEQFLIENAQLLWMLREEQHVLKGPSWEARTKITNFSMQRKICDAIVKACTDPEAATAAD